jgi:hypothetical protein
VSEIGMPEKESKRSGAEEMWTLCQGCLRQADFRPSCHLPYARSGRQTVNRLRTWLSFVSHSRYTWEQPDGASHGSLSGPIARIPERPIAFASAEIKLKR